MAASGTSKFNVATKFQHYCEFEWCINGFSTIKQNLNSPQFCVADDCPLKWIIVLELLKTQQRITNGMNIKLEISDKSINNLKVKLSYKLIAGGIVKESNTLDDIFPHIKKNAGIEILKPHYDAYYGYSSGGYYDRNKTADIIVFQGNITLYNCCQKKTKNMELTRNKYLSQLQIDFKSLFKGQELTDVALNLGNEVIRAHKFVLCARSPVFRRMFQQDFKEAVQNSVDVKDMEKSVLENFLEFLYTGVVGDCKFETVTALYSAADKYEVKTLQEACREILISFISENTAPVILKLSDMHNDDSLKEITIVYICDCFVKVELTPEWGHLLDTDPRLASYTLRRVSTKISK